MKKKTKLNKVDTFAVIGFLGVVFTEIAMCVCSYFWLVEAASDNNLWLLIFCAASLFNAGLILWFVMTSE